MNRRYFSEWENWHKTFISSHISVCRIHF